MHELTSDPMIIQVLTALTKRGSLDQYQIASEANLTLTAVTRVVDGLVEQGLLRKTAGEPERFEVDSTELGRSVRDLASR